MDYKILFIIIFSLGYFAQSFILPNDVIEVKKTKNIKISSGVYKDPLLEPFLEAYIHEAAKYKVNIDPNKILQLELFFSELLPKDNIGLTRRYLNSNRNISVFIKKSFYLKSDYFAIEQLMFHELTHALFKGGHLDKTNQNGNPVSIMNSWHIPLPIYETNREKYLKQLFTSDIFNEYKGEKNGK
jgi:hypothetical protein